MKNLIVKFIDRLTWVAKIFLENVFIFLGCVKVAQDCIEVPVYECAIYVSLVVCIIRFIKKCCE